MCRPSLVHPPPIRRLRDLTRYRRALVSDRSREMQRVEKLLEDAQIKISSVLSDIHGVSGRAMMEALIAGQRDPWSLARLAKGNARKKTDRLEEALRRFFTDHHATSHSPGGDDRPHAPRALGRNRLSRGPGGRADPAPGADRGGLRCLRRASRQAPVQGELAAGEGARRDGEYERNPLRPRPHQGVPRDRPRPRPDDGRRLGG